jgi:hypothetical protein
MKTWFTKNAIHFAIIGFFIALCYVYFPAAWQGKVLQQSDVLQAQAGQKEILDIKERDGDLPLWTNSMFGGMPTYQVLIDLPSNVGTYIMRSFKTIFPHPIDVVLLYLFGAYLLFITLRVKPWLAAIGAIAFAFTSYNFIYIEAGHSSKAYAIAFLAPILAGILLTYRGKYLLGGVILAFAVALEIRVNHIQIPYYMFIALIVLTIMEAVHAFKSGQVAAFGKAIGVQAITLLLAVAVNASLLWPTYEYSKESIRGKSNIALSENSSNSGDGVSRAYAYEWSQGVGETITFLIPNAYGGGSYPQLDGDSDVVKLLMSKGLSAQEAVGLAQRLPTYWGDKPFTSGPWYFGAAVMFLFVLGAFIVKSRLKWWLVGTTFLLLLLSFGRHFPLISDLFFDYFPMYNKFRAVESILVIVTLLVPILAVLAIQEVIDNKGDQKRLEKLTLYVFAGVGGLCLLIGLVPTLFLSFKGQGFATLTQQLSQFFQNQPFANEVGAALVQDRAQLASSDAFRSLLFVAFAFGSIWLMLKGTLKPVAAVIVLGLIILVDMWGVNKRFLNDERFVEADQLKRSFFNEREVNQIIRMDKDPNYRVLDLTTNAFSDARPSYFHKSIGGYHAAKLMRFQEVLEKQLSTAINEDVLDMLNTRYVIVREGEQAERVQRRSTAAGNAWFVDKVTVVKDNEQEMQAISSFDPLKEAFVHQEFEDKLNAKRLGLPVNASIEMTSYRPDRLVYSYSSPNDAFAVFSEVWYDKGWKATVDGKEVPIIRANYLLRGLQLPGGNHEVVFSFEPKSYHLGETISLIASIILIAGLGYVLFLGYQKERKKPISKS